MKTVLSLKNVVLQIPQMKKPILDNFSLEVYEGDFLIILGHNGSGKSSLLHLISKGLPLHSGLMEFFGKDMNLLSFQEISKRITMLTQDLTRSTFQNLTVLENCFLAQKRKKEPLSKNELIEHLSNFHPDLKNKLNTAVKKLSGGQRQILALAMCLLSTPQLFLLDEHTSALDPVMGEKVMDLTLQFIEKKKITTLMTTHNLAHALKFGNRLIAIQNGVKIFETKEKYKLSQEDLLQVYF